MFKSPSLSHSHENQLFFHWFLLFSPRKLVPLPLIIIIILGNTTVDKQPWYSYIWKILWNSEVYWHSFPPSIFQAIECHPFSIFPLLPVVKVIFNFNLVSKALANTSNFLSMGYLISILILLSKTTMKFLSINITVVVLSKCLRSHSLLEVTMTHCQALSTWATCT